MNYCFKNKYLLSTIIDFLDYKDILSLSICNKELNKILSLKDYNFVNIIMNDIFTDFLFYQIFKFEWKQGGRRNYNDENEKGEKSFAFEPKKILKLFEVIFGEYKEITMAKEIPTFFNTHIYLPDLRKECFHLDFEKRNIQELFHHDSIIINKTFNYMNYITFDNTINPERNLQFKMPFKKSMFEDFLFNLISLFQEFVIKNKSSNSKNYNDYENTKDEKMREYYESNLAKKDEENEELKKKLDEKDEIIIKLKQEIEVQ